MDQNLTYKIDNLQYCNWSEEIFKINREAGLDAVHVTIAYHEDFDELQKNINKWEVNFDQYSDLIIHGKTFRDIEIAKETDKTAVFFGFQNCSPIEDNINLVEEVHKLGVVFMQLTYNNQSLLATGCYEETDSGVTRMGREVIKETNAITHANPSFWYSARRNKSSDLLKVLGDSGGMLGLSLYPHHLLDGTDCTIDSFCSMVARTAEIMGVKHIGIGSDLCLKQPDSVVDWMRNGTWTKTKDYGEGTASNAAFPDQPIWFQDARGFSNLEKGLKTVGFDENEIKLILGNNWFNFYKDYIN